MPDDFRIEKDSMGSMRVLARALYGPQTARAVENFPISDLRFSRGFIKALGLIKSEAARTNQELGLLPETVAIPIIRAAQELSDGRWDDQMVVDIFQTGSGTSTNMNANEVIAHRAAELASNRKMIIHPNDHVNLGQSSNDVIPSAIHLAALTGLTEHLLPALQILRSSLSAKAPEFAPILKIGRTHLQDATPIRLGQEFSGYASQIGHATPILQQSIQALSRLALGGTAVGTGINTHKDFATKTIARLSRATGLALKETDNHFAAQSGIEAIVQTSAALKGLALSLVKVANDIRWLGSGPRCGLGELLLPATQPGSSIMPGKVNPVMCEMLIQVCAQVIGNDAAISFGATQGAFELNTMLPICGFNLIQSIEILANAVEVFAKRCVDGLQSIPERCSENLEKSLAVATALAPVIGYDKAAEISKSAYASGRNIREVALEMSGLDRETLNKLLDPEAQVGTSESSRSGKDGR
jgi:fumarate hydratase class II